MFFTGLYSKKAAIAHLTIIYLVFVVFILASIASYPGNYSILTNAISNLGNLDQNPFPGWLFFSIGLWILGPLVFPHYLYQYRALKAAQKYFATIFLVISVIICIGIIGVGMFSEVDQTFLEHVIFAVMAFGGLFFAGIISWIPLIIIAIREKARRKRLLLRGIVALMMLILVGTAVVTAWVYLSVKLNGVPESGLFSISFWEWMLFFAVGIHSFLLTAVINFRSV